MDIKRGLAAGLLALALASSGAQADSGIIPAPKPGETPRQAKSITIRSVARIDFESPFTPGYADLGNPDTADGPICYTLQVSVAELMRQAGVTGYSEEAYEALKAQPGFDPETSYILLCQTEPIEPGDTIRAITLGALPDGSTLPAGEYRGELHPVTVQEWETGEAEVAGENTVVAHVGLSVTAGIPFTVKTGLARLTADAEGRLSMSVFNPVDSETEIVYCLMISQAEIERVSGSGHRTEAELAAQASNPDFDAAYEFLTLFTSEPVAPGRFLTEATLSPLPDGQALPGGEYTGWLVRYAVDPETGALAMLDVNTQVQLVIP